jgi:signal transduction histidine kinase
MVLHNAFFLVLTIFVYYTLAPFIEGRLQTAEQREVSLILATFRHFDPLLESAPLEQYLRAYSLVRSSGAEFGLPPRAITFFNDCPGALWRNTTASENVYKRVSDSDVYYRITLPLSFYSSLLRSVKMAILSVLGLMYTLAVLFLEIVLLPRYLYQPVAVLLAADAASRAGDTEAELIPDSAIAGDELGEIMRSRNATVRLLREHERGLERQNAWLAAAKRSLEAQDRLASLGLLSASIAHEMNTPLAVLQGSIEQLREALTAGTLNGDSAGTRLDRIQRVAQRLSAISSTLLGFTRRRPIERSSQVLTPLIDEAWQLVAIDDKARAVHYANLVPSDARVHGNAGQLVQLFVNLLRNALNAIAPGGHVTVRAQEATIEGRAALAVAVEDDGTGIPPDLLPHIFEAFVSTRLDAHGTGLGLTVAAGLVAQHGGTISAANAADGGARLELVLPVEALPQS